MEHRWGKRIELVLPVRLNIRSRCVAQAPILNVSLSGAFVATRERLPSQARIDVEFNLPRSRNPKVYRVPGYVVRTTESGIALEWGEFAPHAIKVLIALFRVRVLSPPQAQVGRSGRMPAGEPANLIRNNSMIPLPTRFVKALAQPRAEN